MRVIVFIARTRIHITAPISRLLSFPRQFIGHHIDFMLEIETILYILRYSFSCRSFYFSSISLCSSVRVFFLKFWNSYNQYGIVEVLSVSVYFDVEIPNKKTRCLSQSIESKQIHGSDTHTHRSLCVFSSLYDNSVTSTIYFVSNFELFIQKKKPHPSYLDCASEEKENEEGGKKSLFLLNVNLNASGFIFNVPSATNKETIRGIFFVKLLLQFSKAQYAQTHGLCVDFTAAAVSMSLKHRDTKISSHFVWCLLAV